MIIRYSWPRNEGVSGTERGNEKSAVLYFKVVYYVTDRALYTSTATFDDLLYCSI